MADTEEAAKVLDCAWRGCVYEGIMNINTAYGMAIKVLRESALRGWVKTADRVPEKRDGSVIFIGKNEKGKWFHTAGQVTKKGQSKRFRDELEQKGYTHWMKLPEVEE